MQNEMTMEKYKSLQVKELREIAKMRGYFFGDGSRRE